MTTTTDTTTDAAVADKATFHAECDNLLDYAVKQDTLLRKKAITIASAIMELSSPEVAMMEFFTRQNDRAVALKKSGAKAQATALGKGWNRVKPALAYHFDKAGLSAKWPAWTAKEITLSDFSLIPTEQAREVAKEQRAKNAENEAKAIARDSERRQADEISRLQQLSIDQLTDELLTAIRVSGLDPVAVVSRLNEKLAASEVDEVVKTANLK